MNLSLKYKLNRLIQYYRINDWWHYIIPPILSFYFLGIINAKIKIFDYKFIVYFALLLIVSIATASFGFVLGEWSDIKDDKIAGKKNRLNNISTFSKFLLTSIPLIFIFFFTFFFHLDIFLYFIIGIQLCAFILYSIPPFRLKRKKKMAVILDAIYSGALFYIFAFSIISKVNLTAIILLLIWAVSKGIRNILGHLLKDKEFDKLAGINTIATDKDFSSISKFINFCLIPFEIFSFSIFIYYLGISCVYLLVFWLYILYVLNRKQYIIPFLLKRSILIEHNRISEMNLFYESVFLILCVLHLSYYDYRFLCFLIFISILFPKTIFTWIKR